MGRVIESTVVGSDGGDVRLDTPGNGIGGVV